MSDNRDTKRIVDYEKTVAYFQLHEVRFKILAFMSGCTFVAWLVVSLVLSQANYKENKNIDDCYGEFKTAGEEELTND